MPFDSNPFPYAQFAVHQQRRYMAAVMSSVDQSNLNNQLLAGKPIFLIRGILSIGEPTGEGMLIEAVCPLGLK